MSARKKILMVTTQLGYGGAETSFIRLANFLAQHMEVSVALFTRTYGMESYATHHEPLNASIALLDDSTPCGRITRWCRRIRRLRALKKEQDVTISFLSGPNLVNALAGKRARTIVSLRGSRIYDPVAPVWQRRLFQYVLDPITFSLAARIVPVSAGLANEMGRAARKKICVIPPFIELARLQQTLAAPAPESFASLKGQPVMVAVGRLSVEKGFHHLIRIFARLAKQHAGAKLMLVGDGPMLQQLRAQCATLGLAMDDATAGVSAVLFTGYQSNIMPLMALGRVFVLTSATEGFPSVLVEAMVAGVPVIAADTPWGARAILGRHESAQAYPTTEPTVTHYGIMMPRIDLPEYESVWVETLEAHLYGNVAVPAQAAARPAHFDIAIIGAQWQQLIEEVT